jgi:excisionase family DNA binding protein
MTKKQACEALGISERTLDKHAREGRLSVQYVAIKTGKRAEFDQLEVERLKADLERAQGTVTDAYTPLPVGDATDPQAGAIQSLRAIAPLPRPMRGNGNGAQFFVVSPEDFPAMAKAFGAATMPSGGALDTVPIADRLIVDLDGAAALSGLSRGQIREAIKAGELAARKIGRGWKIERAALDRWVKTLFSGNGDILTELDRP